MCLLLIQMNDSGLVYHYKTMSTFFSVSMLVFQTLPYGVPSVKLFRGQK